MPAWQESYRKAEALVKKMSLVDKVNVTTGTGWAQDLCVGVTGAVPSVGFPSLCLQDGPLGIRFSDHITAFPSGITVGATWNRDLMYRKGRAHALEARLKGVNVLLGPAMGPLGRFPAGGRNWEAFGPDPVLQGVGSAYTIKGIQDEGVIATAKHFILNEQEHYRRTTEWGLPHALSVNIDDRTLHELYLWPFAESVKAGVASVMCSYNMVNNSYACGNSKLMNGILKDELGFQGFVQSDWGAQPSGVGAALSGLDMSMPGDGLGWMDGDPLWGFRLSQAVLNGSLPIERLNDMVTRTVAAWYQLGQDDKSKYPPPPPEGDGGPNFSSWTNEKIGRLHNASDDDTTAVVNRFVNVQGEGKDFHGSLVREIGAEGTVLLKNEDNILPLSPQGPSTIKKDSGDGKYHIGIFGEDAGPGRGMNICPDRDCNQGTLASGWGSGAVDFPYLVPPSEALEKAFDSDAVELVTVLENKLPLHERPTLLKEHDLCIVFANSDAGEGFTFWHGVHGDRNDLRLQKGGDALVERVAKECGNGQGKTIVVIHSVGPVVLERWIDLPGIKAVVWANLPGQESGNSLVDVLFGRVDASGRLPYTIGKSLDDYGSRAGVLYRPNAPIPQQNFTNDLYIDYRHFDKYSITPRYEFGFGLSYTSFSFSNLVLTSVRPKSPFPSARPDMLDPPSYDTAIPDPSTALFPPHFRKLKNYIYPFISSTKSIKRGPYPYPRGYSITHEPSPAGGGEGGNPSLYETHVSVNFTLKNDGKRKGKQTAQVYVSFPSGVVDESTGDEIDFPVKALRGFEKLELDIGESKEVQVNLTRKDFSYWSRGRANWVMPTEGKFKIMVGSSSRNLPLEKEW